MKCVNCGKETEGTKLLCPGCTTVDTPLAYMTVKKCSSFGQRLGEVEGVCENNLACEPIKLALQRKPLIDPHIGHIVCKHPQQNLSFVVYKDLSNENLTLKYGEFI